MPFTSVPDQPIAQLTDAGRHNFARVVNGEISFVIRGFSVGRGGYNDTDPVLVSPIDGTLPVLEDQFFPTPPPPPPPFPPPPPPPYKNIERIEYPTNKTAVIYCRLASSEGISGLGELGVWAEIIYSINPSEIGSVFMMAVAHYPIITKTFKQVILHRIVIQF
jgi:hypothetical protein